MRSSCVIQVSPKSNHKCPYKRQKRRRCKEESHVKIEAEIGVIWPQTKDAGTTRSRKRQEIFSPRAFRGSTALLTP